MKDGFVVSVGDEEVGLADDIHTEQKVIIFPKGFKPSASTSRGDMKENCAPVSHAALSV